MIGLRSITARLVATSLLAMLGFLGLTGFALDQAFERSRDPLAGGATDPRFDRLFTRIVMAAPAPIGVGPAWRPTHA